MNELDVWHIHMCLHVDMSVNEWVCVIFKILKIDNFPN